MTAGPLACFYGVTPPLGGFVDADFDAVESDLSLEELDFSDEPDLSLELDPSVPEDELDPSVPEDEVVLAEPLVEVFADSRLSVR